MVIAHGDLDGLASAAALIAAIGRLVDEADVDLEFSQPYSLHKTLARVLARPPDMLFLVDLGLDEATWLTVRGILRELIGKGCRVVWIDHHVHTLEHSLELALMGVCLLHSKDGCASTIARRAFAKHTDDPAFFERLTKLGEIADGVVEGEKEMKLLAERLVAALSAPSSKDKFKRRLVKTWIRERRLIDDEVAVRAEEYERALLDKMSEAKSRIVLEVDKGLLLDARDSKLGGFAGHIASKLVQETGKVVVVVFAPNTREVIATCRVPRNIDFNAVEKLTPIAARLGGGGGGLEKAAAVRVPRELGDRLVEELSSLLRKELDPHR